MSRNAGRRRGGPERGSAALEAAIGLPAFLLFVGLIIFAGRVAIATQAVDSAATQAARTASIARTAADGTGARIGDNDSVVPWGASGEDVHHAQAVPQGVPPERDRGGSRS